MSLVKIYDDIEQGSPEWFDLRKGKTTASRFKDVMAKGQGKTRRTYMMTLAGEIITGVPTESFQSADMVRGHLLEPEARALYEMTSGNTVQEVGLITMGNDISFSPDGLVGDEGSLEIKTRAPHLQLALLDADVFPKENMKQVQGGLWVSGRQWMDYISYWPGLPPWITRVERDEAMIQEISTAVFMFIVELKKFVKKIEAM
jgi:predicted phage-related endonuclease